MSLRIEKMIASLEATEARINQVGGFYAKPDATRSEQAALTRMERKITRDIAAINDLVSQAVTGQGWSAFCKTVRGNYVPSVCQAEYSEAVVRWFESAFEKRFRRAPYVY